MGFKSMICILYSLGSCWDFGIGSWTRVVQIPHGGISKGTFHTAQLHLFCARRLLHGLSKSNCLGSTHAGRYLCQFSFNSQLHYRPSTFSQLSYHRHHAHTFSSYPIPLLAFHFLPFLPSNFWQRWFIAPSGSS